MGQKFSDLKAALSTMENDSGLVRKTGVTKGSDVRKQSGVQAAEGAACGDDANQSVSPFENLYGSSSDTVAEGSSSTLTVDKHCIHRGHASKTLSIVCGKRLRSKSLQSSKDFEKSKKKHHRWVLRFHCALLKHGYRSNSASSSTYDPHVPETNSESCICTGFRNTGEQRSVVEATRKASSEAEEAGAACPSPCPSPSPSPSPSPKEESNASDADMASKPVIDLSKFNPADYPIEDYDEDARVARGRELAEGVDVPRNQQGQQLIQQACPPDFDLDNLTALFQTHLGIYRRAMTGLPPWDILPMITAPMFSQRAHTQIDYIHYLVPDLLEITMSPFYWGKMDRYEADRLLDGKPEGTFLLRDSAQEEYLFSVSFRKYGRSLHARIEEWNHQVSFDSHDPSVFVAPTVCALIAHYNDPSCCMFFEPVLTNPLYRDFPFSLQRLCGAVVSSMSTYDGINKLMLPKALKNYLKKYHYKQRVCVRRLDIEQ